MKQAETSKVYTIPQKPSNSGSIHDAASDLFDREIRFRKGTKYAVVLSSYYGGKGYTTHKTLDAAVRKSRKETCSNQIIDTDGMVWCEYGCEGVQIR